MVLLLLLGPAIGVWDLWLYGKGMLKEMRPLPTVLAAVFGSFSAFGYRVLYMNTLFLRVTPQSVFYYVMGVLWFIPVVTAIDGLLELLASRVGGSRPAGRGERLKVKLVLFVILCSVQLIHLYSFWPGGFGMDAVYEMRQVTGDAPLSDAHPAFWALSMRLLWTLCPHPAVFTAFQLFAFAWLVTEYLMLGWDSGVRLPVLAACGAFFLLLPNQAMSGISVVKDYPFMLALLWGTLLVFRLVRRPELGSRPGFLIACTASMFLMMGFRHNGICPAIAMAIVLVVLALRGKRWQPVAASVMAFVLFAVMKGPVYTALNVEPNTQTAYTPALCAVGSVVNKDLPLSDEAYDILEILMSLDDWKYLYNRFEGHDLYMWSRPGGGSFDAWKLTPWQVLRVYGEALIRYPDVVLLDRLNGMDILWNMIQPSDGFNIRFCDAIYHADFTTDYFDVSGMEDTGRLPTDGYRMHTGLSDLYRMSDKGILPDLLFWRSGAYLFVLAVGVTFMRRHRLKAARLAAVPLWANVALSVLGVYQQSFRYVYFVQVLAVGLILLALCEYWMGRNNDEKPASA